MKMSELFDEYGGVKEVVQVGDVNIAVSRFFDAPSMYKYFNKPKKKCGIFKPKEHACLRIHENHTDEHYVPLRMNSPMLSYRRNKIEMDMWITINPLGIPIYERIKHIGYLTGLVSKNYEFCHGAGFVLYDKGVLLIGQSGNGKSTLTALLDGAILHDDFLLVSSDTIQRVGKRGIIRRDNKCDGFEWIDDDNNCSELNIIFLLNNQYDPNYVRKIESSNIPAELMFDDSFHQNLFDAYKRRMPVNFEVPVFEIGTKREPTETKKVIEDLLSDVKVC